MNIAFKQAHSGNYRRAARGKEDIRYLVLHFTANDGDTAKNNADYFARAEISTSAHYFVDENEVWQSVADHDIAWHCGTKGTYYHPYCRNANSIGIEMCSRKRADGSYYILPETVANAAALAREIMQRYGIDTEHVLRHYDVTGKRCPMPWVDDPAQWVAFKEMLTPEHQNEEEDENMVKYKTIADVPEWYRSEVQELMDAGALKGTGNGVIDISEDVVRGAIIGMRYAEARNPRYYSIDDVPSWAREETQRLIDRGALQGDGKHELNVTYDALQAMIVCQRMVGNAKEGKA